MCQVRIDVRKTRTQRRGARGVRAHALAPVGVMVVVIVVVGVVVVVVVVIVRRHGLELGGGIGRQAGCFG